MQIKKRTMVAGAMAVAVGLAGAGSVGLVSAAASNNTGGGTSIVDKIATKFNLNKSDVQAVFDEDRESHEADMQARMQERLSQAVTDGKLTQDQADYITQAMAEIKSLTKGQRPDEMDQSTKDQLKAKMDALRAWAQENDIDLRLVGRGPGGPGGHMGGPMMSAPDSNSGNSSGSSSSTD